MRRTVQFILSDGMNSEGKLYRVKKDCAVHFVPDVSLVGMRVRFFIDYPAPERPNFNRYQYRELPIINPTNGRKTLDCFDNHFELYPLPVSGSFHFYYTTDGSAPRSPYNADGKISMNISGIGYLTVDPHFTTQKIGDFSENITEKGWDLDGVVLHTCLPKNLGPFDQWDSRLMVVKEGKYNMVHFTPLQELGYSGSAYSLRDQLKVNPMFTPPGSSKAIGWDDIQAYLLHLENDWSVLSMADLVFNHTSNDSPWLHEHPECAYNVVNSPHLVPAYLVDFIVWRLTVEIINGSLAGRGVSSRLHNASSEMPAMRSWLHEQLKRARLEEFFLADINEVRKEFIAWILSNSQSANRWSFISSSEQLSLRIAGKREGHRFGASVDFTLARKMFAGVTEHAMPFTEAAAIAAADRLKVRLEELNNQKRAEIAEHIQVAVDNVMANAYYRFYDPHGLRLGTVTLDTPIMWSYFYQPVPGVTTLEQAEAVLDGPNAARVMAFNGWVLDYNPLNNFAAVDSYVYLRRELVVWGDSVKLRYGEKPEDCPFLWERMAQYAELTARMFHAVRLDNCHSTPLPVAQYMLDRARAVRPNLYVVAELFTSSEYQDNLFINKLGLNSLIRESLQPHNAQTLGSHLYRYGVNRPAGAFFTHVVKQRLYPSVAHALLYDQTHDNPSVAEKHCVYDYLPLSALTAIACCASGSTRGYDEVVPHHINVVTEERPYAKWPDKVNAQVGMVGVRSILNELHTWLSVQGFTETFVDQVTANIIAITRICPETRESVVLVAHTAFNQEVVDQGRGEPRTLELGGHINRLLLEAQTVCQTNHPEAEFKRNAQYVNGLENVRFPFLENVDASESKMFRVEHGGDKQCDRLYLHNFLPGSVIVVSVRLTSIQEQALCDVHAVLDRQFTCRLHKPRTSINLGQGTKAYMPHLVHRMPSIDDQSNLRLIIDDISLVDLNRLLFRCEAEETSEDPRGGSYDVPNFGKLCYCGFESISALLDEIRDKNDLGHPICNHLRGGDWLAHYLCNRLCTLPKNSEGALSVALPRIGQIFKLIFEPITKLPRYLVPAYFDMLVNSTTHLLHTESVGRMASWINDCSSLFQRLTVATNQFYGFIGNCRLPPPTPAVPSPTRPKDSVRLVSPHYCSLSAGLPHFAEGMWRCWGRDTFIALRGCLLLTDRFEEAANLILSYATLLRHGLIPNLTGEGSNVCPRYNCRDSVWFWLYSIVCYEKMLTQRREASLQPSDSWEGETASEGSAQSNLRSLLDRPVWRWFHTDDSPGWPNETPERRMSIISMRVQALHEVIQEVLQRHATGIEFVERNAGPQLDEQMRQEGFKVTARIDSKTGFPSGGNAFNCGTWMDKMGSSEQANNRGIPATPRDGSAVELVGLAHAVIEWLHVAHQSSHDSTTSYYPHSGVQLPDGKFFTWSDWLDRLKASFEPAFWIPSDTTDPSLIYNKGIYRDSVGSSSGFTDNQFRPNFLVTMVVAPSLFTPTRAWEALEYARERLLGPYGMRTLSVNDMAYRGDYINCVDSADYATSKGFNYHQGPEWLWPTGYYIRARLYFARLLSSQDQKWDSVLETTISESQQILARLDGLLLSTPWRSLPELTNSNGQFCPDSSAAQAWSVGCVLEAAYDLLFPPQP